MSAPDNEDVIAERLESLDAERAELLGVARTPRALAIELHGLWLASGRDPEARRGLIEEMRALLDEVTP